LEWHWADERAVLRAHSTVGELVIASAGRWAVQSDVRLAARTVSLLVDRTAEKKAVV